MKNTSGKTRLTNRIKTSRIVGAALFSVVAGGHVYEIMKHSGINAVTVPLILAYLTLYLKLYFFAVIYEGEYTIFKSVIKLLCTSLTVAIFTRSHIDSLSDFFAAPHFDSKFWLAAMPLGLFTIFPEITLGLYTKGHNIIRASNINAKRKAAKDLAGTKDASKKKGKVTRPGILDDLPIAVEVYARDLLLDTPNNHGYNEELWTVSLFKGHLKKEKGVTVNIIQTELMVRRLGFVVKKGGTIHPRRGNRGRN